MQKSFRLKQDFDACFGIYPFSAACLAQNALFYVFSYFWLILFKFFYALIEL
jgi:hypothetical protein